MESVKRGFLTFQQRILCRSSGWRGIGRKQDSELKKLLLNNPPIRKSKVPESGN